MSVLVYTLHSLEYVLGLARFRVFVPKLYNIVGKQTIMAKLIFLNALIKNIYSLYEV